MSDSNALPDVGFLDAKSIRFERTEARTLTLRIGEDCYEDVTVRRAFPLEMADAFIGLFAADGEEIGLIEDLAPIEADSRRVLDDELQRTYFLPVITNFGDIGEEFGVVHADVQTTSGPRHIEIRGIRSNIRLLSRQRALIEDTDGNRYELRDMRQLPKLTREILGL